MRNFCVSDGDGRGAWISRKVEAVAAGGEADAVSFGLVRSNVAYKV